MEPGMSSCVFTALIFGVRQTDIVRIIRATFTHKSIGKCVGRHSICIFKSFENIWQSAFGAGGGVGGVKKLAAELVVC